MRVRAGDGYGIRRYREGLSDFRFRTRCEATIEADAVDGQQEPREPVAGDARRAHRQRIRNPLGAAHLVPLHQAAAWWSDIDRRGSGAKLAPMSTDIHAADADARFRNTVTASLGIRPTSSATTSTS